MSNNMPKAKVCRNCRNTWREGDKYCRYCGAPMVNPGYIIREFSTIYGPMPVRRKHVCSRCKYTWETELMIDDEDYCPQCGAAVSTEETRGDVFGQIKQNLQKAVSFTDCLKRESDEQLYI